MKVPITKPYISDEEKTAVMRVLDSGQLASGPKVREFEELFAAATGASHAIATSNGTTALHLALISAGIGPGDEVITTAFTFIASANSILMAGATPVFADIDPKTFNISPQSVAEKISPKTKAILTVNLFGLPCDYAALRGVIKGKHILIIEDACQSIGSKYQNQLSGSLGDVAAFSLYATKNITTGEGGMVTTNTDLFARNAKMLRNHSQPEGKRYVYEGLGYNYRLTDLQAAIGVAQILRLETVSEKRRYVASAYTQGLQDIEGLQLPSYSRDYEHVYHQYTICLTPEAKITRDMLKDKLLELGVGVGVYYPIALHRFKHLAPQQPDLPATEYAENHVLSLPMFFTLTDSEIEFVISSIKKVLHP